MRLTIIYLLLLFGFTALGSCTNDESDDGMETLTPDPPKETGVSDSLYIAYPD